uniref:type IV secretion protein Rhs n=1 Tax=Rodentibacter caecimuris TaxID=1796644 RepID=UPI002FF55DA4
LCQESTELEHVTRFNTEVNSPTLPPMRLTFFQSPHTKRPLIGMPYTLYADGRELGRGVTDNKGEIEIVHEEHIEKYEIRFVNGLNYEIPMIESFEKESNNDELMNEGFYQYDETNHQSVLDIAKVYDALVKGLIK